MSEPARLVCNACEGGDTQAVATLRSEIDGKEYEAVRCRSCGLVFASPIPDLSFEGLQDVYGAGYTEGQRESDADPHSLALLREATHRQMEIVERHVSKGVALNVGAMNGGALALVDRGWRLRVVEVSRHAAETARARWGFDVTVSRIEDYECPPGTFDFIKLGHVIEHLADPARAVRRLAAMLRPGGVILVDTDNAGGLRTQIEVTVRKLLGERLSASAVRALTGKNLRKRYGRLIPPVHLYTFTETSLTRLLAGAGFEVLRVGSPAWGDPTWFPLAHLKDFSRVERVFIRIDQLGSKFGRGDLLSVLARRASHS